MYQGRTRRLFAGLPALITAVVVITCKAASAAGTGATVVFSYPNGFAGANSAINTAYDAADFSGSVIQITNGAVGQHEGGAAWYKTQVNIQSFTTTFAFQLAPPSSIPTIQGITFCVQNSNATTNPGNYGAGACADANLCGYGVYASQVAIANSIGLKFDLQANNQTYHSGGSPNSTGLYINGGPEALLVGENDLNPYGINLYSGHVFSGTLVYDGTLLTMTILDTTTKAQGRYVWPINIPAVTQSNTAYVGFTGGEIAVDVQNLLSWSYYTGYNTRLAAPTFSVTPGSYSSTQTVSISGPVGATIYYTTNGLLPTSSSTLYTGPITVSSSEVIQAVAIESGYTDSYIGAGNYQIASAGTPLINFPSGFTTASNLVKLTGYPYFNGASIQLTDSANLFEVGGAWYAVPVNIQTFSTSFNLQFTKSNSNGYYGLGTTFCIQNQPATTSTSMYGFVSGGTTAMGNGNSALGYGYTPPGTLTGTTGGMLSSIAVKFDLSNNSTGLYTDGALPTTPDVAITGVTLTSGHPLTVSLSYDGTTLSMTITDSVTSASFSHSWTINIPTTVGGNTAYVGFTAASGYFVANQDIQSWTYAVPPSQAIRSTSSLRSSTRSSPVLTMVGKRLIIGQEGRCTLELLTVNGRRELKKSVSGNTAIDLCTFAKGSYVAILTSSQCKSIQRISIE